LEHPIKEHAANEPVKLALILAAGNGRRLGPEISQKKPKPLLSFDGKTILDYQVEALAEVGVEHIAVVVGYNQRAMYAATDQLARRLPVSFSFIENPIFDKTNTIYSMYLAAYLMGEHMFILNGDVLFPVSVLKGLLASVHPSALAVDVKLCGEEEVKVVTGQNGRIERIGKKLQPVDCLGEFIGVARFDAVVAKAFADSLRHSVENEEKHTVFFEYALDRVAAMVPLFSTPFYKEPIIEIDFPEDFERAKREIVPRLRQSENEDK